MALTYAFFFNYTFLKYIIVFLDSKSLEQLANREHKLV